MDNSVTLSYHNHNGDKHQLNLYRDAVNTAVGTIDFHHFGHRLIKDPLIGINLCVGLGSLHDAGSRSDPRRSLCFAYHCTHRSTHKRKTCPQGCHSLRFVVKDRVIHRRWITKSTRKTRHGYISKHIP